LQSRLRTAAYALQGNPSALRMFAENPAFTLVAALSVGLGIGVNCALFSFHDAILLHPLPVPEPDSVVSVTASSSDDPSFAGRLSYPNYRDLRERSRSFDGLVANQLMLFSFARSRRATREMRLGAMVSENFFSALAVQPMLGRAYRPEEGSARGRDAVVVRGYDFWKNTLGADTTILNSVILINGVDFQVIGVAPESFTGLDQFVRPSFYVPFVMAKSLNPAQDDPLDDRKARSLDIKGRLKSGTSIRSAQAEMVMLWHELQQQYPDANRNRTIPVRTELEHLVRATPQNAIITVMMTGLAAVVLMIACANVANLLLSRARGRSREIAIRLALGVSRTGLLRQLLMESLLLALFAAALGLAFAYGGIRFFRNTAQALVPTDIPVVIAPQLDYRTLIVSLSAALLSALLFGLAPSWQSLKTDLVPALKGLESDGAGRRRLVGRNVLVIAQVALSMVLLVAAGMLQAGSRRTLALDPGFRTDHLVTMALDTSFARYTSEQTHTFYRNLVDRARMSRSLTKYLRRRIGLIRIRSGNACV
jgi:putative ABC transport system permease protein